MYIEKLFLLQQKKLESYEQYREFLFKFDWEREKFNVFNRDNAEVQNQVRERQSEVDKALVSRINIINVFTMCHPFFGVEICGQDYGYPATY